MTAPTSTTLPDAAQVALVAAGWVLAGRGVWRSPEGTRHSDASAWRAHCGDARRAAA